MSDRIRILVLSSGYLPGYKAGGPIRSVSGMIDSFGDEFEFRVITRDRDLGEKKPYSGITPGTWLPVGKAKVMYLTPKMAHLDRLRELIVETPHDIVYLGGGFDPTFVLRALLLRRLGLVEMPCVMLAPQGVFSRGALRIKAYKKRPFCAGQKLRLVPRPDVARFDGVRKTRRSQGFAFAGQAALRGRRARHRRDLGRVGAPASQIARPDAGRFSLADLP